MLVWRTTEIRAATNRGEYHVHARNDASNRGYGYFMPNTGGAECIQTPDFSSDLDAVVSACEAHAANSPHHPMMSGWPADAELEAP